MGVNCMFRGFYDVKYLSCYDGLRVNNFTALRFFLALVVLFGHSFPISGNGSDPVTVLILPHAWIGSVAVGGFFAVSGFLVSASISNRSLRDFAVSRALRLYPAVMVYSLVAIFIIGPMATSSSLVAYFHATPWNNLWNSLLWEWSYNLPYAFSDRPFAGSTNGSTWTLPAELRCYVAVFVFGLLGFFSSRSAANMSLLLVLFLIKFNFPLVPLFGMNVQFQEPLIFFIVGSFFWINREYIPLSWILCFFLILATFFAAGTAWYFYAYIPAVVYTVLMIAYRLPYVDMDRFGDISYGLYIYAWPIQQLVWAPGQSAYENALYSSLIVIPLAYLSWRFVESPALRLRAFLGGGSRNSEVKATSVARE